MVSSPESGSWIERIRYAKEQIILGIGRYVTQMRVSLVEEGYDSERTDKTTQQASTEAQIQELRRNLDDDVAVARWISDQS